LFIRKSDEGKLKFNSFDDLKGKKIGVVRAYAYTPEFWKFMEAEKNFDDVVDDETNFKKLNAGRIDFVAAEYGNASMILRKLGLADKMIPLLQNPIRTTGLYLIFNKQKVSQKFTDDFSSNLKAFKATPAYKSIYQKYF
jgi:polar amino acid transport system substrate-binding protein